MGLDSQQAADPHSQREAGLDIRLGEELGSLLGAELREDLADR